jgi:hypothetical protein
MSRTAVASVMSFSRILAARNIPISWTMTHAPVILRMGPGASLRNESLGSRVRFHAWAHTSRYDKER